MRSAPRRIMNRPRYVAGLVAGAAVVSLFELMRAVSVPVADYRQAWLFVDLGGWPGLCLLALRLALYGFGAWGLWLGKSWARWAAMAYLAAELSVFVVVGAGGWGQFFGLHILIVPYATFGFMYLQRGAEDFR